MNFKNILFLLILLCDSCMLSNDIDLEFPASEQRNIIECYLKPGEHFELTLMETNSLSKQLYLHLLWGAKVDIINNKDTIHLLNILNQNKKTHYTYNYGSPLLVPNNSIHDYELEIITLAGDTLRAKTNIVSPVVIAKTELFKDKLIVSIDDVDSLNPYYVVSLEGSTDSLSDFKTFNFDELIGDNAFFVFRSKFNEWGNIKIRLFHITKEHYDFLESTDAASGANLDPFTVPEQIKSNIVNGIGIFTYQTVDSITIDVNDYLK